MNEQEYDELMSSEDFASFECVKCGEEIDTEEALTELMGEPFNGTNMECPNEECDAEYDLSVRINVELL